MDKEQNILRYILKADLIPKDYNDLKEEHIKMINRLIVALDERDEYHGKLLYTKEIEQQKLKAAYEKGKKYKKPIKDSNPIHKYFKKEEQ